MYMMCYYCVLLHYVVLVAISLVCHYTTWSPWSECSTSTLCSGGLRTRHRNITNSPTVPELCSTDETKECQLLKCGKILLIYMCTASVRTISSCKAARENVHCTCTCNSINREIWQIAKIPYMKKLTV